MPNVLREKRVRLRDRRLSPAVERTLNNTQDLQVSDDPALLDLMLADTGVTRRGARVIEMM